MATSQRRPKLLVRDRWLGVLAAASLVGFLLVRLALRLRRVVPAVRSEQTPLYLVGPENTRSLILEADERAFAPFNLTERPALNPSECQPSGKVGFMKTHKTASSTIQNILLRYGLRSGLNFVLPKKHNALYMKGRSTPIEVEMLKFVEWHSEFMEKGLYDIYAIHGTWNATALRAMLGDAAPLVTIVRDPADAFESTYGYYNVEKVSGLTLAEFIKKMDEDKLDKKKVYGKGQLSLNNMMWDLGLPLRQFYNPEMVGAKLKELDSDFDLVMVSELMDESLVLLAHLLCLPLHAMVGIKRNARKEEETRSLTDYERDVLRRHLTADEMLYGFFRRKLQHQILQFGKEEMQKATEELRRLRAEIEAVCLLGRKENSEMKDTASHEIKDSVVVYEVREDVEECALMGYSEPNLISLSRRVQRERYLGSQ